MRKPFVHYQIFMHLLTTTAKKTNKLHSRQSIFLEMFTLLQHILLDREGDCTRRDKESYESSGEYLLWFRLFKIYITPLTQNS